MARRRRWIRRRRCCWRGSACRFLFPLPIGERVRVRGVISWSTRYRAARKANCGSRPAGGLLSLVCPRESNQREGHPVARRAKNARSPVLLAPPGRCATRHALYEAWLKQCSRKSPGGAAVLGELGRGRKPYQTIPNHTKPYQTIPNLVGVASSPRPAIKSSPSPLKITTIRPWAAITPAFQL